MAIPEKREFAIYGLFVTPALHLADRHGILDRLLSDGPATGDEVARRAGTDPGHIVISCKPAVSC